MLEVLENRFLDSVIKFLKEMEYLLELLVNIVKIRN